MLADGPRIVRVLKNPSVNAARHAPASSPIRVAAMRDGTHVAVSVPDEGPGGPAARLPRLFRKRGVGGHSVDPAEVSQLCADITERGLEFFGGRVVEEHVGCAGASGSLREFVV